jgi:hypothetical protein
MDRKVGEEKKESGENVEEEVNTSYKKETKDRDKSGEEDDSGKSDELAAQEGLVEVDEELEAFPAEIIEALEKRGFNFESKYTEKELLKNLDEAGYGDLRFVLLESGPRLIMPSKQHNTLTRDCVDEFQSSHSWGKCYESHKIYLSNGRTRDPDVSFWGLHRCFRNRSGKLKLLDDSAIPDVIIQFSWRNTFKYEEKAIDDMMNCGLEHEDGPPSTSFPRLGYLIKAVFGPMEDDRQDVIGVEVYRLPHGTTIAQALDRTDAAAQYWMWTPGDAEMQITVTPEDVGTPRSVGMDDFVIPVSTIFDLMNR